MSCLVRGSIYFPPPLWKTSFASICMLISIHLICKFVLQIPFKLAIRFFFSNELNKIFIMSSFFICMNHDFIYF